MMTTESNSDSNKVGNIFHQNVSGVLRKTLLLLDNQITVDKFINLIYFTNIYTVIGQWRYFAVQGGHLPTSKVFLGPSQLGYSSCTINVITLKTIKNIYCVTYNSNDRGDIFTVHSKQGAVEFIPHQKGLQYQDTTILISCFQ